RRVQRRARRKLSPAPWLVPVTPDVRRRVAVITREWERVDPSRLADDELRLSALGDRVAVTVDRASFDDLVTMVTSAPTWEKDRMQGVRILLRAIGEGNVDAPEEILSRWTWRLARATRKLQDRRAGSDLPEAKRLLGALTNSRGHRHEENAARL